jgi:hypothetical protein
VPRANRVRGEGTAESPIVLDDVEDDDDGDNYDYTDVVDKQNNEEDKDRQNREPTPAVGNRSVATQLVYATKTNLTPTFQRGRSAEEASAAFPAPAIGSRSASKMFFAGLPVADVNYLISNSNRKFMAADWAVGVVTGGIASCEADSGVHNIGDIRRRGGETVEYDSDSDGTMVGDEAELEESLSLSLAKRRRVGELVSQQPFRG